MIDHFSHVYRCRDDKVGGGVSLYIYTSLEYQERHDLEKGYVAASGESVFIETGTHVIIG